MPLTDFENPTWWMSLAECKGHSDIFFPTRGEANHDAKALCAKCPVRKKCLEYALDGRIDNGIWGGMSERERRKIRVEINKQRRLNGELGVPGQRYENSRSENSISHA